MVLRSASRFFGVRCYEVLRGSVLRGSALRGAAGFSVHTSQHLADPGVECVTRIMRAQRVAWASLLHPGATDRQNLADSVWTESNHGTTLVPRPA
jgi:hypothetical protein